jgi:hypothetical protein
MDFVLVHDDVGIISFIFKQMKETSSYFTISEYTEIMLKGFTHDSSDSLDMIISNTNLILATNTIERNGKFVANNETTQELFNELFKDAIKRMDCSALEHLFYVFPYRFTGSESIQELIDSSSSKEDQDQVKDILKKHKYI